MLTTNLNYFSRDYIFWRIGTIFQLTPSLVLTSVSSLNLKISIQSETNNKKIFEFLDVLIFDLCFSKKNNKEHKNNATNNEIATKYLPIALR